MTYCHVVTNTHMIYDNGIWWRLGSTLVSLFRVAALALQALNASHTHPLIFNVENLMLSSWQVKLKRPAKKPACQKLHTKNPHARNLQHASTFLSVTATYVCTYTCQEHIEPAREHVTTVDSEILTWLPDTNFSILQIWNGSNVHMHTCIHKIPRHSPRVNRGFKTYPATSFATHPHVPFFWVEKHWTYSVEDWGHP